MNDTGEHNHLDQQDVGPTEAGLSRRDFLRTSGAAATVAALAEVPAALAEEAPAQSPAKAIGPEPVQLTLDVNGAAMTTYVEPRVTLLDALRNYLDVTGCKRVCDRGTCGACTVMVDGKPIYSCTLLALEAEGKKIKTAESLIDGGKLDAVPAAFVKHDAQQCGFCTPGFVVAMRAAFDQNPNATPAEIEEALSGNICRCGTYQQMRDAIVALCKNQPGLGTRKKEG
jgi:xanthine dehydrogenase YagT iron-sulfur-binding subunit